MARETAAQKREREALVRSNQEVAEWAEFTATYAARFADLMFQYMSRDYAQFRVVQEDQNTYTFSRAEYRFNERTLNVTPPVSYDWEYKNQLDQAEELLADYAAEQAEQRRKETVRMNALNKLTAEERELLKV